MAHCNLTLEEIALEAYIVTDSSNYEPRARLVGAYLKKRKVRATYVFSAFLHAEKKKKASSCEGTVLIDAGSYRKNISPARLIYHARFAKKAYEFLKDKDIDLLYVLIPGNSLVPMAVRLKNEKKCRLVLDLIDLWPESLPLRGFLKTPPALYWKNLRVKHINDADVIMAECAFYIKKAALPPEKTHVMHWVKAEKVRPFMEEGTVKGAAAPPKAEGAGFSFFSRACHTPAPAAPLSLAYLGAINNIIDIPAICALIRELSALTPVSIHVIGGGERKDEFLNALSKTGAKVKYHGFIYAEEEKESILRSCSFGLNIMKAGLTVGLTMKSIEYMANGLPLINTIPGDTWDFVEKLGLGVNLSGNPVEDAGRITGFSGASSYDIYNFYMENFTVRAAEKALSGAGV